MSDAPNPLTMTPSPLSYDFDVINKFNRAAGYQEKAGQAQEDVAKKREEMGPQRERELSARSADLDKTLASPHQPYPGQQTPPEPPKPEDYRKYSMEWVGAMAAFGAFAGRKMRGTANASLKAFGAALNGWQEGNAQAYKEAAETWKNESARVLQMNRQRLEEYRAILDDRSLTVQEQMGRYKLAAAKWEDRIGWDAARAEDYSGVAQHYTVAASTAQKAEETRQVLVDQLTQQDAGARGRADEIRRHLATPQGQQWWASLGTAGQFKMRGFLDLYPSKAAAAPEFDPRLHGGFPTGAGTPGTEEAPLEGPAPAAAAPTWKSPLPPPLYPAPGQERGWTWDKIDFLAAKMNREGPQGMRAFANYPQDVRAAISERAADMAISGGKTPGQLAAEQAGVKGATLALGKLKQQDAAVDSYGRNMLKNGDVLLNLAKKVDKSGSPVVERWTRAGRKALAGDPDVTEFDLQLRLWIPEIARTATNPNLTGVLTEGARKEIESVIPAGATVKQFERIVSRAHKDFENRRDSIKEEITLVEQDISGEGATAPAAGAPGGGDEWGELTSTPGTR